MKDVARRVTLGGGLPQNLPNHLLITPDADENWESLSFFLTWFGSEMVFRKLIAKAPKGVSARLAAKAVTGSFLFAETLTYATSSMAELLVPLSRS